ncbi:hypothetical protein GOP47_0000399 [Adiantum capillus-veneris]|uniref:Uncharacterized protein n=1 Tax=Adiantum capillus-veneris TaxID=13818 RepID=A0A9D4VDV9_ADICA|nr:hypothetical protein GOP47_0000399 [Adiantum capillus-veneris]
MMAFDGLIHQNASKKRKAFDKEGMAKILLKNIYHYHELPNHIQLNHPMKNLVATDLTHIYRAFTKNMKEDQMR